MLDAIISKDSLSLQMLQEIFSNAYIDFVEEDGELLIKDPYKVYVLPDTSGRFIRFLLLIKLDPKAGELKQLRAVNQMNSEYLMFQNSMSEGVLYIRYHFWTEGGVSPKSIVSAYKFFSKAVGEIIDDMSKLNVIV